MGVHRRMTENNNKWVNIGIAIKSVSGKAITLVLPNGKLHISINQLLNLISGQKDYAVVGFLAGDKISSREKRMMRNAYYRMVRQIPQRTHKTFLHSLTEEEKHLLGKT